MLSVPRLEPGRVVLCSLAGRPRPSRHATVFLGREPSWNSVGPQNPGHVSNEENSLMVSCLLNNHLGNAIS